MEKDGNSSQVDKVPDKSQLLKRQAKELHFRVVDDDGFLIPELPPWRKSVCPKKKLNIWLESILREPKLIVYCNEMPEEIYKRATVRRIILYQHQPDEEEGESSSMTGEAGGSPKKNKTRRGKGKNKENKRDNVE